MAALVVPLTGLEGGDVRQCGVRALGQAEQPNVSVDISLERLGRGADLVVRAVNLAGGGANVIKDVRVERDGRVLLAGAGPATAVVSGVERRMSAAGEDVTSFLRDLMVQGAAVVVTRSGGTTQTIDIAGPLPHSVRAAYLNCAGDLYRPGE